MKEMIEAWAKENQVPESTEIFCPTCNKFTQGFRVIDEPGIGFTCEHCNRMPFGMYCIVADKCSNCGQIYIGEIHCRYGSGMAVTTCPYCNHDNPEE